MCLFNIPWSTLFSFVVVLLAVIITVLWAIFKKLDGGDE